MNNNNNTIDNMKKNIYKLEENKRILELKLELIEEDLKIFTEELYNKCVSEGGHYFHREYDYQLYGEVTLTCVNCGYIK